MADKNEVNFLKKGRKKEDKNQSDESSNSKKPFIFIGLISITALFLGFFQIYKNIHSPFETKLSINSNSQVTKLTGEQLNKIDSLKNKDTDGDGLLDYDELYSYNTSPYLKDSDSDGFDDKEEIDSDNDPNCPAGLDCSGITGRTNTNVSSQNGNTNNALVTGEAEADSLRQTLKDAGVPQYMLENTSDKELMEIYNRTIDESSQTNTNTNSNLNSNTSNSSSSVSSNTNLSSNTNTSELPKEEISNYLENLSAGEIRAFLMEYGVSEEELSGVDDETLQAIFLRALEEQDL